MADECACSGEPVADCSQLDLSWLLQRAAQRLAEAVQAAAVRRGVGMRAQLVLTALAQESGRTQLALGTDLAIDKTTLTTELDRLESCGLVERRPDPRDRRVRIPEITDLGRKVQAEVADTLRETIEGQVAMLSADERAALESSLRRIIEHPVTRPGPSVVVKGC